MVPYGYIGGGITVEKYWMLTIMVIKSTRIGCSNIYYTCGCAGSIADYIIDLNRRYRDTGEEYHLINQIEVTKAQYEVINDHLA